MTGAQAVPAGGGGAPGRAWRGTFRLSMDEGGQFVVATRDELVLGHLRSPVADLLFLADVGARHARLSRYETLRGGPGWRVAALGGERVEVNGEPVGAEGSALVPGDSAVLAANLAFRLSVPDPASHACLLEFLRGTECLGSHRAILLGEGPGGCLRIGAAAQRHVRVPGLEAEASIQLRGGRLLVRCDAGLRTGGRECAEIELDCPPLERIDIELGPRRADGAPYLLSLEPLTGDSDANW